MDNLLTAHYFSLPTQGNIYTLAKFDLPEGSQQILFATLKREIFCFEYISKQELVPTIREVPFTYIASGAEIVALDIFNKSLTKNEFVVGVTIVKSFNHFEPSETYLNIYAEWEERDEFVLENIAQHCYIVELSYMPYHLTHTYLITWQNGEITEKECVFLLSGGDGLVHCYRASSADHSYKEIDIKEFFPEFTKVSSPILHVDVYYSTDYSSRFSAICCECGYVRVTRTSTKTNKVEFAFSTKFNAYISTVCLYKENEEEGNKFSDKIMNPQIEGTEENEKLLLGLVVVNTVLPAVVFHDILTYGLSNYTTLPRMGIISMLSSVCVVDIDLDGEKEILIGSTGSELLLYKQNEKKDYNLECIKKLASPIFALCDADFKANGIMELAIFSMKGLLILEYEESYLEKRFKEKIAAVFNKKKLLKSETA